VAKVTDIDSPKVRNTRTKRLARTGSSAPKPLDEEKSNLAFELLLAGKSQREIAEAVGYQHKDDASRLLTERFKHEVGFITDMERKQMLGMALLRLNALLGAVWPAAMMGDPKSVDSARAIVAEAAKISGLQQIDPVVNKNLVLVMGEKEQDYIEALKAAGTSD